MTQIQFLQAQIDELKAINEFLVQLNKIARESLRQARLADNLFSFSPGSKVQPLEGRAEPGNFKGAA